VDGALIGESYQLNSIQNKVFGVFNFYPSNELEFTVFRALDLDEVNSPL